MSGRWIGASAVARRQTQLMRPVTYDWSVLGQARDLLEWFFFCTPSPMLNFVTYDFRLGVVRLVREWFV